MQLSKQVCVVGAGKWGKNHIRTLNEFGALGGIVEADNHILNNFQEEYPYIQTFQNLDDALGNNNFIGFTIATPAEGPSLGIAPAGT